MNSKLITEADWFRCKVPGCGATLEQVGYQPGIVIDLVRYKCPKCKEPHRRTLFSDYNDPSIPGNIARPESNRFEEASMKRYLECIQERLGEEIFIDPTFHMYPDYGEKIDMKKFSIKPDFKVRSEAVEDIITFYRVTDNASARQILETLWNSPSYSDGICSDDKKNVGRALGVKGIKLWWRTLF